MKRRLSYNYENWKVHQLKTELYRFNLPVSGNKDVLIERLRDAVKKGKRRFDEPIAIIKEPKAVVADTFENASILTLPADIMIGRILPYLEYLDVYSFAQCSKHWYRKLKKYLDQKAVEQFGPGADALCFNIVEVWKAVVYNHYDSDSTFKSVVWSLGLSHKAFGSTYTFVNVIKDMLKRFKTITDYIRWFSSRKYDSLRKKTGNKLSFWFNLYRKWRSVHDDCSTVNLLVHVNTIDRNMYWYNCNINSFVKQIYLKHSQNIFLLSKDPFIAEFPQDPSTKSKLYDLFEEHYLKGDLHAEICKYKKNIIEKWNVIESVSSRFSTYNPLLSKQVQILVYGNRTCEQIMLFLYTALGKEVSIANFLKDHPNVCSDSRMTRKWIENYVFSFDVYETQFLSNILKE